MDESKLLNYLTELLVKSTNMLSLVSSLGRPKDDMKILEMTLNKEDCMLDKTKLFIIKMK